MQRLEGRVEVTREPGRTSPPFPGSRVGQGVCGEKFGVCSEAKIFGIVPWRGDCGKEVRQPVLADGPNGMAHHGRDVVDEGHIFIRQVCLRVGVPVFQADAREEQIAPPEARVLRCGKF